MAELGRQLRRECLMMRRQMREEFRLKPLLGFVPQNLNQNVGNSPPKFDPVTGEVNVHGHNGHQRGSWIESMKIRNGY
jgi:hypothetical protein